MRIRISVFVPYVIGLKLKAMITANGSQPEIPIIHIAVRNAGIRKPRTIAWANGMMQELSLMNGNAINVRTPKVLDTISPHGKITMRIRINAHVLSVTGLKHKRIIMAVGKTILKRNIKRPVVPVIIKKGKITVLNILARTMLCM